MELFGRTDCNVLRIAAAPMQARVLEFTFVVPVTHVLSESPWSDYPVVTYSDPAHPKYNFVGKAITAARQFRAGETIKVTCADAWRELERKTARLTFSDTVPPYTGIGTSKIRIREGKSVADAINIILNDCATELPGGVHVSLGNVTDEPNPNAPTVVAKGQWVRATAYVALDMVTFNNKEYYAYRAIPANSDAPISNADWVEFVSNNPQPHGPILFKAQDKTGQKIATWLHDILDQTESGMAYVDHSTSTPSLIVCDYGAQASVPLIVGAYQETGRATTTPLFQSGESVDSIANKYKSVIVEGAGKYTRQVAKTVTPTLYKSAARPGNVQQYTFRFYFDETNISGFYYTTGNIISGAVGYRFQITTRPNGIERVDNVPYGSVAALQLDTDQVHSDGSANTHFGSVYAEIIVETTPDDTTPVFNTSEWNYTTYDGPLVYKKETDDHALDGAGDFAIHMPKLAKFDSDGFVRVDREVHTFDGNGNEIITSVVFYATMAFSPQQYDKVTVLEAKKHIDDTPKLIALANAYFHRYSSHVDHSGSITVIVKEVTGGIDLGSAIPNFNGARVQNWEFTPGNQQLKLTLSDQPIREYVARWREYQSNRSELYGNARNKVSYNEDLQGLPDTTLNDLGKVVDPPISLTVPTPSGNPNV